jgi:hypothetical protein
MPRLRRFIYGPRAHLPRIGVRGLVNHTWPIADNSGSGFAGRAASRRGCGMQIVNQLAGSLAQSASVTRQQSTDKSDQIRRAQALRKDVAAGDTFEHQVESSEELTPIHDEQAKKGGQRRKRKKTLSNATGSDSPPNLDITA